jgi:polysaccharide export outer membrane protein
MATTTPTRAQIVNSRWGLQPGTALAGSLILCALLACPQRLVAQQQVQPVDQRTPVDPANTIAPARAATLRIAGGDLLQVTVFDTPELSSQLRVAPTGEIELPWGGTLHVEGSTAEQAAAAIEASLKNQNILKYPHRVTVFIAEYATQGVKVLGQVKTPGVYPLLGTHRLYDMIASAGGVTDFAARQVIVVHQGDAAHPVTVELNYSQERIQQSDIEVLPGDTIVVQKAGVVYVLGDVGRPGGFLIQDNQPLTVLRALSLAQGINKTAKLNSAVIFRNTAAGQTQSPLALKQVLHGKATDLPLSDHDILYVPSSIEKTLGYRGIELAAQATAGVIIYK